MRWISLALVLGLLAGCCEPKGERMTTSGGKAGPPRAIPGNTSNPSFGKAKRVLAEIHDDHRETLYCACKFDQGKNLDREGCGYVPVRDTKRSRRIEWEHVVPAHAFGESFPAWKKGHPDCVTSKGKTYRGRRCARKVSTDFRYMEADMYNLQPAVGALNMRRSNYVMTIIAGERRAFGRCDFEVHDGAVEPRPAVRGDIARTYLYMDAAYRGRGILTRDTRAMFEGWGEKDPVDRWECERARRIADVQGNENVIVAEACRAAGL